MSQEFRNVKWSGRPPALETGDPVQFELDGEAMSGTITGVKGRVIAPNGKATERGQVTFAYEDISGMRLTHTLVGPK